MPTIEKLSPFGVMMRSDPSRKNENLELTPNQLRVKLLETPLLLIRDFQISKKDGLLNLCALKPDYSDLLHWEFGPLMNLQVNEKSPNYLFSRESVPFHWDGAFHRVPTTLAFHCLEAPDQDAGGETLFTNTQAIYADASFEERELWSRAKILYETAKKAHYGGTIIVPVTDQHPRTGQTILRFAEAVETKLNPVSVKIIGLTASEEKQFKDTLLKKIYSPKYCYVHSWQSGDLLFADNHALIHGRRAFSKASPRHIQRVQIL